MVNFFNAYDLSSFLKHLALLIGLPPYARPTEVGRLFTQPMGGIFIWIFPG